MSLEMEANSFSSCRLFMFCTLVENPGIKLAAFLFECALVRGHLIIHCFEVPEILRDGGIKRHQRLGELLV